MALQDGCVQRLVANESDVNVWFDHLYPQGFYHHEGEPLGADLGNDKIIVNPAFYTLFI